MVRAVNLNSMPSAMVQNTPGRSSTEAKAAPEKVEIAPPQPQVENEPASAELSSAQLFNLLYQTGPTQQEEILSARLTNPNLSETDRELLNKYYSLIYYLTNPAKIKEQWTEGDVKDIQEQMMNQLQEVRNLIASRMILLGSEVFNNYTGREATCEADKQYGALDKAAEFLRVFNEDERVIVYSRIYESFLSPYEQTLIQSFKDNNSQENLNAILNQIYNYSAWWMSSVWGTKSRVDLFRRMCAFSNMAYSAGVPTQYIAYYGTLDFNLLPQGKDLETILGASFAIETPEKTDDNKVKSELLQFFVKISSRLFKELENLNTDLSNLTTLSIQHTILRDLAIKLGIPKGELDDLERAIKNEIPRRGFRAISFSDIFEGTKVLTPDELPAELRDILSGIRVRDDYSYFQFLKDNVSYIVTSSENFVSESVRALIGSGAGGELLTKGVIYLNTACYMPEDLKNKYYMAEVIAHESYHACVYNQNFGIKGREAALTSIINEGGAFGFGAKAVQQMKSHVNLDKLLTGDRIAVEAARSVVGLLPLQDKDLNVYPTQVPLYVALSYANYLSGLGMIKPEEVQLTAQFFNDLIFDNTDFEKIPDQVKPVVFNLLRKIDGSSKTYEEALSGFKIKLQETFPGAKLYGLEMLQSLFAYSFPYEVKGVPEGLNLRNENNGLVGVIPEGAQVIQLIASPMIRDNREYAKISYRGKEGYVLKDYLQIVGGEE